MKMKKWKKTTIVKCIVLIVLFVAAWYLFLERKNVDAGDKAGSKKGSGEEQAERLEETEGQTRISKKAGQWQETVQIQPELDTASTNPADGSGYVTEGTEVYRGFVVDNVLHSASEGDIHYNVYIPESYDGSTPYALYFTLPGYEGLYFQGVAANIRMEEFGFEAQKYNDKMIIVAPQLNDWIETSADQTIALVEYFLQQYNIDTSKVYGNGYSGGGETMSIVMGKRPDLFTAYLHVSSQWDGEYEPVVRQRLPVYLTIGRNDEYYGSALTQEAYDTFYRLYGQQGLTKAEIDELLVLDIKEHDYFTERNAPNEHGGGGFFAYDEEIMGWLFSK